MLNQINRKTVLLALAFLLTLLFTSLVASPVLAVQVYSGTVTQIDGDAVTIDGNKKFVPANEHAKLPNWVKEGTRVKVGYYNQNKINYYREIGKLKRMLEVEKQEAWDSSGND